MSRLLILFAVLALGFVARGGQRLLAPPSELEGGAAAAPVMTWLVLSQVGTQRETVPPLVLYVDANGRKQATAFASETPWAAAIEPGEMARCLAQFDPKPADKNPPQPKETAPKPPARSFQVVFGNTEGKAASFTLNEAAAKAFVGKLSRELLTSREAVQAALQFGKTYGW